MASKKDDEKKDEYKLRNGRMHMYDTCTCTCTCVAAVVRSSVAIVAKNALCARNNLE